MKTQKVITWASQKRVRSIQKAAAELGQSESRFLAMLNGLSRKGLITVQSVGRGRSVELHLTQSAYYNRSTIVF